MSNFISFLTIPFAQALPIWLKILYGAGLFGVALIITVIIFRILQALFKPQTDSGLSQSVADSIAGRDMIQAGRDVHIHPDSKPESETIQPIIIDKRTLVERAIIEAKKITPKGKDIPVYITDDNRLRQMIPQELKSILDILQDENILELKTFPKWILPYEKFTKDIYESKVDAVLDPTKNHFTVRLLKDLSKPDDESNNDVEQVVEELLGVGIFPDMPVIILRILYHDKDDLKIGLSYRKVLASEQDKLVYGEFIIRNIVQLKQLETGDILVLTELGKGVILYLEKNPQVLRTEGSQTE